MSAIAAGEVDGGDELALARDMVEVHGTEAASVARGNARTAVLGGQRPQARHWLRVLGIIQQPPTAGKYQIRSSTRG